MEATNREKWKSVNGFANYEISSCGRVRNATTERILKPRTRRDGYLDVGLSKNGTSKRLLIHRLVAEAFIDNPEGKRCVDHIDSNRKNNNCENLRPATHAENGMNSKKHIIGTSIYKGVSFHKQANKWWARIVIQGKTKSLGLFDNEREAGMAYNLAAVKFYKQFANLNVCED